MKPQPAYSAKPVNSCSKVQYPAIDDLRQIAETRSARRKRNTQSCQLPMDISRRSPSNEDQLERLMNRVEERIVSATWTLRRLPNRERGYLKMRGMLWPDTPAQAGDYAPADMTAMQARRAARIAPEEIDRMQPSLDLLQLLPDVSDRKLLFWAAWHQDGELQAKIPWAKVRRSMDCTLSRWTLKRRYDNGLRWLASIILAQ